MSLQVMFPSLATLQLNAVLQLPGVIGRAMVTDWVAEVAVSPGLCDCMLWISTVHKQGVPTAACVTAVSFCVHTLYIGTCVYLAWEMLERGVVAPAFLPQVSTGITRAMGLLTTAGIIHAALLHAAGCIGWPALPMETLA